MIYIKRLLPGLAALFLIALFAGNAQAQAYTTPSPPFNSGDGPCDICPTSVSAIRMYDFPNAPLTKGFSATTGGWGHCEDAGIVWATSDPNCNINDPSSPFPLITFSGPGTYQVCAKVKSWYDRNGNGIKEPSEICTSDQFCITITI